MSLRSISGWVIMHHLTPLAWGCIRQNDTAQSSCQAEVHAINETTKLLLSLKLLFRDINLPIRHPITIHNDNTGAVQWSKGTTTKKMKWVDLRENLIQENVITNNIQVTHKPGKNNVSDILTKEFKDTLHYLSARDSVLMNVSDFLKPETPKSKSSSSSINYVPLPSPT